MAVYCLNFLFSLDILFRKLIPTDIAVVNMAINISIPYIYLKFLYFWFIT